MKPRAIKILILLLLICVCPHSEGANWSQNPWYSVPTCPDINLEKDFYSLPKNLSLCTSHVIVVATSTNEVEQFAAQELQTYLYRITNAYIPITSNPSAKHKTLLRVGNRLDERLINADEDEFITQLSPGKLLLSGGGDRGTLYSVYAFLEECLGCRWYYADPHDELIPLMELKQLDNILARGFDKHSRPAMRYRSFMILCGDACVENATEKPPVETQVRPEEERAWLRNQLYLSARMVDWMAKNRANVVVIEGSMGGMHVLPENWDLVKTIFPAIKKRGLQLGIGGHFSTPFLCNLTPGWPGDNAWGPLRGGKRLPVELVCRRFFCTSNPAATDMFLGEIVRFFRANPEFDIWSAWLPDGGRGWCKCPSCKRIAVTQRYLGIFNKVAQTLHAEAARPDSPIAGKTIQVTQIGYNESARPPKTPCKLHDNLAIMPDVYQDFNQPYKAGAGKQWKHYLAQNGGHGLIMFGRWTRTLFTGYHLAPPSTIAETINNLVSDGFIGVENFQGAGGWWVRGLWQYSSAKAMWDPGFSQTDMLEQYYNRYYGPAAKPMREFIEANERAHAACTNNFHYLRNYDTWYPTKGALPGINPARNKNYPGVMDYLNRMLALETTAKRCFANAEKLAATSPDAERIMKRIGKARLSCKYFINQKRHQKHIFEGILHLERAQDANGKAGYMRHLSHASASFSKARECYKQHMQLVEEHTALRNHYSADAGAFWDGGVTWDKRDYSQRWLEITGELQEKAKNKKWGEFKNEKAWKQEYPAR
jgi:Domain of unknown function (DUF4838)